MAFYQGQYSKAIIKWQEQAIFGNDTEKNLLRISDLFCELGCFHELAISVAWVFANFHKEVITKTLHSKRVVPYALKDPNCTLMLFTK